MTDKMDSENFSRYCWSIKLIEMWKKIKQNKNLKDKSSRQKMDEKVNELKQKKDRNFDETKTPMKIIDPRKTVPGKWGRK